MNDAFETALRTGIDRLRLEVDEAGVGRMCRYAARLLAWNRKVNLTAITAPAEVAEKHFLDSLLLLPSVAGRRTLLDVGSGAGFPGMALACARPELRVTCCDSVGKKVAFVKATAAELGVEVRGIHGRATGQPELDGLPRSEVVVSRALADPAEWVALGQGYVEPGGLLLAMVAKAPERESLELLGRGALLELAGVDEFTLPFSGAPRSVVRWTRRVTAV